MVMIVTMGIALHTASYGLWAWRKNNRRGAIGTWLIAWVTLIAPVLVWWYSNARD